MNRRDLLRSTPLLLLGLSGCAMFGSSGGDRAVQAILQQTIAAQLAAGVLFNGGAALVQAGVIKPGSTAHTDVDAAFQAAAAALDSVNADIQGGMAQPVQALLNSALAALNAAQEALAKNKPSAAQSRALMANRPIRANISVTAILALVQMFLPIIISAGGTIADLIQNLIASLNAPANGVTLTPADVAAANVKMHEGLSAWNSAT